MLLDAGADINSTAGGVTVLARAAYNSNLGLVKMLIRRGADPKGRYAANNMSYVRVARKQGHEDIAQYLEGLGVQDS
jgi:ankyrin repeat protein